MNRVSSTPQAGRAAPLIPVLAVVGVGLIGGSFAAALRQAGQVGRVLGVGRNAASLARALELGLIDEAVSAEAAAARADLIFLATPVGGVKDILARLRPHLRDSAILTDGGSAKAEVAATARLVLGARIGQFVPGHPIAGAERSGPEAADAALYRGRCVVLTPLAENAAAAVAWVRGAWRACGAEVLDMAADAHDRVLASVSHLPHLLSSVYMGQVAAAADAAARLALAGSGFRDFTRIAAGSPEMWRDIFLSNRGAILAELAAVRAVLDRAECAIHGGDGAALLALLDTAAQARRNWREA